MIYKIDVWHKFDTAGNKVQEVYCLSDMHGVESIRPQDVAMMNTVDQENRKALVACCEQLKKDKALFLVEDPFQVTNQSHKKIAAYIPLYKPVAFQLPEGQKPALLQFLADILAGNGCDVINVECRQQRIVSNLFYTTLISLRNTRSPILSPFHRNINSLYGPTVKEVVQEFNNALALAKEYCMTDGSVLADYYTSVITKLEKTAPFADLLSTSNSFYWDIVDAADNKVKETLVNAFLLWGLELIDINTLHALYGASERSKVCIVMGGVHINGINSVLLSLGYHKVQTIGEDSLTEQEYKDRACLVDELSNVNRLIPAQPNSWFANMFGAIKHVFTKNIVTSQVTVDAEKVRAFNQLNTKFAYAKPIDTADFGVLVGK
ncbi:MAG: hypothetical protein NT124_02790 [Candidatus Dependentiae bacterium]|nr:hypothetical protein [Candidatus Dependentiae bacterium]